MRLRADQKIKIDDGDSVEFIHFVNSIMEFMFFENDVDDVVFVKIKNWFDHKWLNYSGKSIVVIPFIGRLDSGREEALENAWQDETTLPPFNPKRVIYSKYFRTKRSQNDLVKSSVHVYQRSTENRSRLVRNYTNNGLLVWFSSDTIRNQRGSLMVYLSKEGKVDGWYAGFDNANGWRLTRTKGIDADIVREMIGKYQ